MKIDHNLLCLINIIFLILWMLGLMAYYCTFKPDVLITDTYLRELLLVGTIPPIISTIYMLIDKNK